MSYNSIQIIGNAGSDPELRYTTDGVSVANFSVAVNYRRGGESGQDETEWFRVSCWRNLAEQVSNYVQKGRKVFIEGRFRSRTYTDSSGQERHSSEIIANRVVFVGGPPKDGEQTAPPPPGKSDKPQSEEISEDLPW